MSQALPVRPLLLIDDGIAAMSGVSDGAGGAILNTAPAGYLALTYQKVTALASDVTLGAAGAVGDALDGVLIVIKTAASTVSVIDGSTTVAEWVSLAAGTHGPYNFGWVSANGAWKINIANSGATGSYVTAGGVFTQS